MNGETGYVPGHAIQVGDVLVGPHGTDFTVTRIKHIGHGLRIFYPGSRGKPLSFTIPADGLARVSASGSPEPVQV